MFFTINSIEIIITIISLSFLIFLVLLCVLPVLLMKNKVVKILDLNSTGEINKEYEQKLFELIRIKTTSYNDDEGYHQFREKLKSHFPYIVEHFTKEKIDGNAIFTYKYHIDNAPNILFATHIDYKTMMQDAYILNDEIYGSGTFDAKSLLYVMFEAVNKTLKEENKLNVNLTIVMTTDDQTTKQGVSHIVDQFLRKGKFFDLVIEEGSGIIDPSFFGIKSYYALVGVGVTGESVIRFKTRKALSANNKLKEFIKEIKTNNLFKSKIDRQSVLALKEISKDMNFKTRFFFNNLFLFRNKSKRIIDKNYIEISKMLKTTIQFSDVKETLDEIYIDLTFQLSTHDTTADVILLLAKYMEKYNIEYQIISNIEASNVTRRDTLGYKIVTNTINKVFNNDLYIAPTIITRISEKRYFDKVSDCVIRFSPLYYPTTTFKDAFKGKEHIPSISLVYGVKFFEEILKNFKTR